MRALALGAPEHQQLARLIAGGGDQVGGALHRADGGVRPRQALAVAPRAEARRDLLADLGLSLLDVGAGGVVLGTYLPADANGATATAGVWAAGNVAAPVAQVVNSAAAGSMVHMDLIAEDTGVRVAARAGADLVGA